MAGENIVIDLMKYVGKGNKSVMKEVIRALKNGDTVVAKGCKGSIQYVPLFEKNGYKKGYALLNSEASTSTIYEGFQKTKATTDYGLRSYALNKLGLSSLTKVGGTSRRLQLTDGQIADNSADIQKVIKQRSPRRARLVDVVA